jgi:putative phage-type endonuclease
MQRDPAWFAARLGKVTASRVADVLARTKTGYSSSRNNYASALMVERLTGAKAEEYTNAIMQRGIEIEPEARDAYAFYRGVDVVQVDFIDHPTVDMSGASPDGLVGDDGLVEIKAPMTATHIDYLLGEPIPDKYYLQMQWQLACTGRKWCDFCSYDPRLPEDMRIFIKRFPRDDAKIAHLEKEVTIFLREIETRISALRGRFGAAA